MTTKERERLAKRIDELRNALLNRLDNNREDKQLVAFEFEFGGKPFVVTLTAEPGKPP